jgi:hypothetical protein
MLSWTRGLEQNEVPLHGHPFFNWKVTGPTVESMQMTTIHCGVIEPIY